MFTSDLKGDYDLLEVFLGAVSSSRLPRLPAFQLLRSSSQAD